MKKIFSGLLVIGYALNLIEKVREVIAREHERQQFNERARRINADNAGRDDYYHYEERPAIPLREKVLYILSLTGTQGAMGPCGPMGSPGRDA